MKKLNAGISTLRSLKMLDKEKVLSQLKSDSKFQYINGENKTTDYIEFILSRIRTSHFDIEKPKETCKWKLSTDWYDDEIVYEASCDNSHWFEDGNTRFNRFKWCPYCGKEIEEVKE